EPRVIGVDLGGTKILTGIVARDGSVEHRRETPTPTESQDALLAGLDSAVEELMTDGVVALGFGIPSRLDQKTGRVEGSVNIPLEGLDFRGRMQDRFSVPVGIENDANAATYGEFHSGAGREIRSMVVLTLGTGCGGGVVNIFDPELVVIGGGFAAAWDFLIEPAREVMERESLAPAGGRVRLARAELGTAAGLIGAGLVAFDAADAA